VPLASRPSLPRRQPPVLPPAGDVRHRPSLAVGRRLVAEALRGEAAGRSIEFGVPARHRDAAGLDAAVGADVQMDDHRSAGLQPRGFARIVRDIDSALDAARAGPAAAPTAVAGAALAAAETLAGAARAGAGTRSIAGARGRRVAHGRDRCRRADHGDPAILAAR